MGFRLKRYGPVRTIAVVGFRAGTGVPAARNFATEYENSAMATTTRGTPSGAASVPGRNGNGMARWITAPETSAVRYTSGGRMRPRFATSRDALEPPPCSADGAVNLFHIKIGQEARSRSSGFLA